MSILTKFWSEMSGTIHPVDRPIILSEDPGQKIFNYDFPPPAFVGDVDNASIVILMGNGGYDPIETPREFPNAQVVTRYIDFLRRPGPIDPAAISPYYTAHYAAALIRGGQAVIVNACAYRSPTITSDVRRLADALPSVQIARRWVANELLPSAARCERLVIAHRPGMWRSVLTGGPNVCVADSTEWRLKSLPIRFRAAIRAFLSGSSVGTSSPQQAPPKGAGVGRLSGNFIVRKRDVIEKKAGRDDPRAHFYVAMLSSSSYADYYERAKPESVNVKTYRSGPISSDMEIKYARRLGWVEDTPD
jgi:hypothetical protein